MYNKKKRDFYLTNSFKSSIRSFIYSINTFHKSQKITGVASKLLNELGSIKKNKNPCKESAYIQESEISF